MTSDLLADASAVRSDGRGSLVDLLDRVLATGVVLSGDVVISLAGVDLIVVRLHALIASATEELLDG